MQYPQLQPVQQYREVQEEFLGINRSLRADPRQWRETTNISPREFPVFAPRERRGILAQLTAPLGILARDALVHIDGDTLYIGGRAVTGLVLLNNGVPKQLVSMGAYIIILPDKKYVNTAVLTDYGSIESSYTYTGDVVLTPARVDGSDLPMSNVSVGTQPPANPVNGAYWIDTSREKHELKQYSSLSGTWTLVPSAYTKVQLPGVETYFEKLDGVEVAGITFAGSDPNLSKEIPALNGSKIISDIGTGYIIVPGILSQVHTMPGVTVTVKREMPALDFITESENRLWGCKYGVVSGKAVNELYACALGDFKNWKKFQGVSTDSYAVSVGTDGKFTGAVTYQGYPLFFKETALHKVYGAVPANYRVETYACRGLQEGSHRSLQIVNELLYYKGRTDVLVYDGSDPTGISEPLGSETYREAVAGAYKHLYYISMKDEAGAYHLYLYDTRLRVWYREDNVKAMGFAQVGDDLYYIDAVTKNIVAVYGKSGTKEDKVAFSAQSGIIGYESADHKYVSRFNIRALIPEDGLLSVLFRYDSVGGWHLAGHIRGHGKVRSVTLPVAPRRCDHFEMKLEGSGDVRVFSIAKLSEQGSDGAWI